MRLPLPCLAIALCLLGGGCTPSPSGGGPISDFPIDGDNGADDAGRGDDDHDPGGPIIDEDDGDESGEHDGDGPDVPPVGDAGSEAMDGGVDGGSDAGPRDAGSSDAG
jgi:hypothetical protein